MSDLSGGRHQLVAAARGVSALLDDNSVGGSSPLLRYHRFAARDAAADTLRALPQQRGDSRHLARTNSIAAGAIKTNVDRVVGTGLALVASPNAGVLGWDEARTLEWTRTTQNEFSLWADSPECDIRGRQNFYDKQAVVLDSRMQSGDCFTVLPDGERTPDMPYRLRLQVLEADRVGNPNNEADSAEVAGGIKLDARGRPVQCFVYDRHPGSLTYKLVGTERSGLFTGEWYEFTGKSGRRKVLHHLRELRPEMPRGVPYLTPVIDDLKQIGRWKEAEIQAAVVSSFLTLVVKRDKSPNAAPVFGATDAQIVDSNGEIFLGPGAVLGLADGEDVSVVDPTRPNPEFEAFMTACLTLVGMALGLPYELLVKRFNSSYSASRAALLDAWIHFRGERTWLARSFCQPVYETWMAEAVASGRVVAPGFFTNPLLRWAYTRAEWFGDSMGSVNLKDEVEAYVLAKDNGLITHKRIEWEMFGTDWDFTTAQKAAERRRLKKEDLLPPPKAGAAAPAKPEPDPGVVRMVAAMEALAVREQPAPVVNLTIAEGAIRAGDTHTHLGDTHTHIDAGAVQVELEAKLGDTHTHIDPGAVQVHHTTVAAPRGATRQVITNDKDGNPVEILNTPVDPAA